MKNEEIEKLIASLHVEAKQIADKAEREEALVRLQKIAETYAGDDEVISTAELLEDIKNRPPEKKIMTGFVELDTILSGFRYKQLIVLSGITKHGKCLGEGTLILCNDGSLKKVEDIRVGDLLMGPDSKPRKVLALGTGREELFEVRQGNDTYIVNKSHILSLKRTRTNKYKRGKLTTNRKGEIVNISVEEYLTKPAGFRHIWKGWRSRVEFPVRPTVIDPYFLGLWLGDGTSSNVGITNMEPEVEAFLQGYAASKNLKFVKKNNGKTRAFLYSIVKSKNGDISLQSTLRRLGVLKNKHIPASYKINDRETRLKVLAGIIDTDGSLSNNKWPWYEIIQKSNRLSEDIVFLARSLGFAVTSAKCKKGIKRIGFVGEYNRIRISGDLSAIPVLVQRKKSTYKCSKDVLTGAITVTPKGVGKYYGFELDGDGLFLLASFIVTHNTSFAVDLTIRLHEENPMWLPFEEPAADLLQKFLDMDEEPPLFYTPKTMTDNSLVWIEKKIIEAKAKYNSRIVFIDHLHFILKKEAGESLEQCIGRTVRTLKQLAVKWDVIVVLITHLKKVELNKHPNLEDLKDSSAIAQEADTVIFMWRQTVKGKSNELEITDNVNVSVQANRKTGRTGNIKLTYRKGRFYEEHWYDTPEDKAFAEA